MDAGYRDPRARMIYSLRSNAKYQLIVLACATVGLVYMIISNGFDFTAVKALVMALAYVWGLILAIYLMGHGLVAVPRRMFRNANVSSRLRRIQGQAPKVHEKLEDSLLSLAEIEAQIAQLKQRKTGTAQDFREWIDELVEQAGALNNRVGHEATVAEATAKVPAVITDRYLADLSRRLARARQQRARYVDEWDGIVQTASDLQTILDSKASKKLTFGRSSPQSSYLDRLSFVTPYMRYHLHIHVIPSLRLAFGGILSLASVSILWSEIIRFPAPQLSAVSLTVIHHPSNKDYQIGFGGQLLAVFWTSYMCACALSSVNDVPVWGQRALVPRNTYPESACWYAGQIAKLTVPLAYNFLTFLPRDIHEKTTFYQFLGRLINLTPLGTWFDYLFPIFILLPVCATFFNLYGKIKRVFGFGIIEDEYDEENPSGFGTGGWREGRDLIARDLTGHGTTTLGLTDSPRPSLEGRGGRPTTRWTPPSERPVAARQARPVLESEPEEENFFSLFGKRVKNTIDTIEPPRWMQGQTSGGGFKTPKWMGGNDAPTGQSSQGESSGGRNVANSFGVFGARGGGGGGQITL